MAGILRAEIDKLVLGYLRETNSTKASQYFCKSRPHLQGEYEFEKLGIEQWKIDPDAKTLVGVLKEYTEIQHIVTNYISAQQNAASFPVFQTLKDKIQYICRIPSQQPLPSKEPRNRRKTAVKRRRPSSTAGTDEDDSSAAAATQLEEMPGHSQIAAKRRKMSTENIVIVRTKGSYAEPQSPSFTSDEESHTVGEASKPLQENAEASRPSTSQLASAKKRDFDAFTTNRPSINFEQTSAMTADATVPFEIFSEAILENQEFQNLLVENINTSGIVDRVHCNDGTDRTLEQQLEQAMENIIQTTQANPIFEDIVREAVENHSWQADDEQMSSSTPNKSSEPENVIDEVVVAQSPVEPSESIKQRLRPRKTPAIEVTASTTKKRKSGKKVEVLSELRTYPNQQLPAIIQTQENQLQLIEQQQLQQQPSTVFYLFLDQTGAPCIAPLMTECEQSQPMAVNNNLNFPTLLDGTVCIPSIISSSTTASLDPGTILNMTDPQNAVVVHDDSQPQNLSNEEPTSSCLEENRIIVIDGTEVNAEALKVPAPHNQINPIPTLAQFAGEQAPQSGTPKQPIQPNVPCSSKNSTTPRHKISHVRVLDFTTPARSKLIDPATATYTGGLDVLNSSRIAANETPLSRTIVSTVPNSAPPKIDSTKSEHVISSILHAETSSSMDTVIHVDVDEDTVISVGSETPKVRKKCRNACVRTLSSHKEVNAKVATKRLKRLASTKKKIDTNEDGADGGDEESQSNAFKIISEEKSKEAETTESTADSAWSEWQLNMAARNDPTLFEKLLREKNSELQAEKDSANCGKRRQSRNPRSRRKATTSKSKSTTTIDKAEDVVTADPNESLNSSVENGCNESNTSLQAHAEMLENNLKSAKKVTPEKKVVAAKTKPKKTRKPEIYIKLPESPKVKALKRHKSATKVAPSTSEVSSTTEQPTEQSVQEEISAPPSPPPPVSPQPKSDELIARANTSDDLEAAQDLLQLNETIIQHAKQLSARKVADTRSDCTSTVTTATISDTIVRIPLANTEIVQRSTEMSLSALLETPMKVDGLAMAMFPKTPGIQLPPQLVTPMLKTVNPMEDSIMKNHEFPTPDFPITPGAILTPRREIGTSPRSDQELIYGAANRPTDYSSSSSYYKPDESDGVDKQLQAMLRVSRQASNAQSADEIEMIDESAEMSVPNEQNASENVSNERLNYSGSSSSSSSSSSSDSDSESDSSDSSSHSSGSNQTQKSVSKTSEPIESIDVDVPETSEAVIPLPDADLVMTIKSHIESTAATVITQSTLLPEPEPVVDKAAEQTAMLAEKRLRVQQRVRQDDLAKPSMRPVSKATGSKKAREDAKARYEALRVPQKVLSPSKRKSTQPRRCINNTANNAAKPSTSVVAETKSIESNKANAFESKVPAPKPTCPLGDEESIDAIKKHLAIETKDITKESPPPPPPVVPSSENLIEILEDKCNALNKRSPSVKTTKQIEPLPLRKVGTRSTKTQNETKTATSSTIKTKAQLKMKCKSTETKKPTAVALKSSKPVDSQQNLPSNESSLKDRAASPVPETPVKERRARQMYTIFGEISDIETPVKKSPVESHSFAEPNSVPVAQTESAEIAVKEQSPAKVVPALPSPKKEPLPSKENLVSSTTSSDQTESKTDEPKPIERTETIDSDNSSSESDDDDDSDDDSIKFETSTPAHLVHVISNSESIINTPKECPPFRSIKLVMSTATVHLEVAAEVELYDSAPQRDNKAQPVVEPPSSTFGKPSLTSTPSSQKSKGTGINPKFNLKHKDHTPSSMQGDENAEAKAATSHSNRKDLEINRKDLNVNKILGYLHPEVTKSKH